MTKHAEDLAKLGWQYFECPACGSEGARAFPKPEQPAQQEPVAWRWVNSKNWLTYGEIPHDKFESTPLYTSPQPAQRTWVELTDDDLEDIAVAARTGNLYDLRYCLRYCIEAKLKEKNT